MSTMNNLVFHKILGSFRRVVALGAFETIVGTVEGHVIFESVEFEVARWTFGAGEDLGAVFVVSGVGSEGLRGGGNFDDDPGDGILFAVRFDASGIRGSVTLRVTVHGEEVTCTVLVFGGMCFLVSLQMRGLTSCVGTPLTGVRELG